MKYENLKSLILTILVLTSLVLTWNLWTYQPAPDYNRSERLLQEVKISAKQEVGNIIRPTQMLFHYEGMHYGTTDSQEVTRFVKEMEKWRLYDIEPVPAFLTQEFTDFMHSTGKMEVLFPDGLPLQTLRFLVGFNDKEIPNVTIDRILIDLENEAEKNEPIIYLVNYDERRVYSAKVNNMSISTLDRAFYTTAVRYKEYVAINAEENRSIFVPKNPVEVTKMHYLSDTIDPEEFKNALFNVPSVVTKDQIASGEVFTDSTRIMNVDRAHSFLEYVNTMNADRPNATDFNVVERSIEFINEHSGWTKGKYLFAEWNQAEIDPESAVFRLYVGDYPVFNWTGLSEIAQVWRNNEVYSYSRPIFELGISIPSEQKSIILPAASEVEKELLALPNFDLSKLQDVRIGYELRQDLIYQGVFVLEPLWVYRDNDGWNKVIFTDIDERGGL